MALAIAEGMEQLPALNWIVGFLESNEIPYVACGGLAAKAYGAERELNDIDIYVPDEHFRTVVEFGAPYIVHGPIRHRGKQWELTYVQFDYLGQDVEIASDKECRIFDASQAKWITQEIDFNSHERREVYGVELNVMNKGKLIEYKKQLSRDVDIEDIAQINGSA